MQHSIGNKYTSGVPKCIDADSVIEASSSECKRNETMIFLYAVWE
jgi:hypothetical protein